MTADAAAGSAAAQDLAAENASLRAALAELRSDLAAALNQQAATADILHAIASSPTNLRSVLDAIAASAARLTGGSAGSVWRVVSDRLDRAGFWADATDAGPRGTGTGGGHALLDRLHIVGRAVIDRRTIHIPDLTSVSPEAGYRPEFLETQLTAGLRSLLATPLLREGEAIGALSVRRTLTASFTDQQIRLLETFASQAVIAIENARLLQELNERDERRRQELERAALIQRRLLPSSVAGWPGVLEIAVRFRAAVETSGDFYDVLRLAPTTEGALPPLQIAVGDVAGKGMSAALVTALARSALRATAFLPVASAVPSSTLRLAGQRLHRDVGAQHFVACALAVLEPPGFHHAGPRLRLANAAQVPVLLVRDGAVDEVTPAGYRLPLGVHPDGDYQDISVELRSGDVVVFSSDGLVEAPAAGARELLGFQRLSEVVCRAGVSERSAEDIAEHIWSAVTSWTDAHPSHDDMTLVVLRVPRRSASAQG